MTSGQTHAQRKAILQEGLSLGEILQVLRFRRNLIYLFSVLSVLGTLFRQVVYIPMYTASTRLTIQKAENSPMQLALANLGATQFDNPDRIKRYTDYLQSNEFFLVVAETLKFAEGYHLLNLTSPGEMALTKRKFWQQFFATRFKGIASERNRDIDMPEPELVPVEQLAGMLRGMIFAEATGSDGVRVNATTLDPFTSMVLANIATEVFVKKTTERDYNEVTEVRKFIQEQLEATTERLKKSESVLIEFKKKRNIISESAENAAFSARLSQIESELESSRIKKEENQRLIMFYQKALARSERKVLELGSAAVKAGPVQAMSQLRRKLDSLRYQRSLMQTQGYAENSKQLKQIDREIDQTVEALRELMEEEKQDGLSSDPHDHNQAAPKQLNSEDDIPVIANPELARAKLSGLLSENKVLEAKISSIETSKAGYIKAMSSIPKDEQLLLTLKRDVDLQFELFSNLKKKLQEVEIQQIALQSHVLVNERAGMPGPNPRTPAVVKLLFALLVGVFLGGTTCLLLEAIDQTIKHTIDLERLELITLGSIPHVEGSPIRRSLGGHSYRPDLLICKDKAESAEAMAFKYIRAQVLHQHSADGSPSKVITITSPDRGDGKTFVSSNLAVALAQLEKRTLLMDCDFRNPSTPWLFGYQETDGLTSLLQLKSSLDEILIRERVPFLDILPAGWKPMNPSELIANDKFKVLLEHLRSVYDYIVIDAPPAVAVVDAAVLASNSDTVILTAAYRRTRKDMVLQALRRMLQVSSRPIYALLNDVWDTDTSSDYLTSEIHMDPRQVVRPVDSRAEIDQFQKILVGRKTG